jgi:hypothetical protein
VRNSVRYYPCFAASSACKQQKWTLHVRDGRPLLWVETCKEVHEKGGLSYFSILNRRKALKTLHGTSICL